MKELCCIQTCNIVLKKPPNTRLSTLFSSLASFPRWFQKMTQLLSYYICACALGSSSWTILGCFLSSTLLQKKDKLHNNSQILLKVHFYQPVWENLPDIQSLVSIGWSLGHIVLIIRPKPHRDMTHPAIMEMRCIMQISTKIPPTTNIQITPNGEVGAKRPTHHLMEQGDLSLHTTFESIHPQRHPSYKFSSIKLI